MLIGDRTDHLVVSYVPKLLVVREQLAQDFVYPDDLLTRTFDFYFIPSGDDLTIREC